MNRSRPTHSDPAATAGQRPSHRKNPMLAHPLKIVAGLFAAGLLACAPAHAAANNAAASLNNIKFELIDLDLTDNISPSITFTGTEAYGAIESWLAFPGDITFLSGFGTVNQALPYGNASTQSGLGSLRADLQVNPVRGEWNAMARSTQNIGFTLSPSTRLLITAEAEAMVDESGFNTALANARLFGNFSTVINGVRGSEQFYSSLSSSAGPRSQLLQGVLNTGAGIGVGILSADVYTSFRQTQEISPVPEPETYGMLLAGLLVVGGVARRNRRATSRPA